MTEWDKQSRDAIELQNRAEEIARQKSAGAPDNTRESGPEETLRIHHQLQVHQIELEMQNEELRRTQKVLDTSRARYFDLYNLAPVGYCTISEKGLILEANLTVANLLNVTRAELIKQPITRFILTEDQDLWYLHRKQIFETGEPQTCELRMARKDSPPFWARMEATAAQDENGKTVCRVVISDISKDKQAVDALIFARAQLIAILESIPAVVNIIDPQTHEILFMNKYAIDLYGLDGTGKQCYEVFHNYQTPCAFCNNLELFKKGESEKIQWENYSKAFDRYFMTTNRLIRWPDRRKVKFILSIDITERKQAEEALRQSEEDYRQLFEVGSDAIFLIDNETGNILQANSAACKIYGYSSEELLTMKNTDLSAEPEQTRKISREILPVAEQMVTVPLRRHRSKNGKCFPVEITARSFLREGRPVHIAAIRDISERKRAEEEHEKLQARLNQAQKMESVGRLAGGVAHDFNNMLSVIIGNTELVMDKTAPGDSLHNLLQEILNAAKRSTEITRQLLAFARKQIISPKALDLNETVEGMLKMLRRLIGEDINLTWLPAMNLWPVRMDPSQIDQILANLCVNARDAITGVGNLIIETENVCFDESYCVGQDGFVPGDYVLLAVSDNGCGMDKKTLSNLFEPFFTTKDVDKGTGLGLAMIYGIVQQNKGFINVYSEPEKGTTFKIYLPRYQVAPETIPKKKDPETSNARGSETILLVEDDPAILKITSLMLDRLGYTVLTAISPGDAIRLAGAHAGRIDLLVTDVVMPEMNGRDLAKQLTALYPNLKILFMSGYTANVIAHHGVLDTGVHFVHKPFTIRDIAGKVRQALERV